MKKWTPLEHAKTPDGKTLSLHEHDGCHYIRINGIELMSTRQHNSEEKLAELGCADIKTKRKARVLVGGLGFGFTLKATLKNVAEDATVVVAEIMPAVVAWNSNPEFNLAHEAMADSRVQIVQRDVVEILQEEPAGFDSILLDVDNGPTAFSTGGNRRLYDSKGLRLAKAALRPGGCLAVWSVSGNPAFAKLLSKNGFKVDVQRARARQTAGAQHTLFLARI